MDTEQNTKQFKPLFPPFEEPERVLPYQVLTICGYIVLVVAFMVTSDAVGYSTDAMKHSLEHLATRSFTLLCGFLLVFKWLSLPSFALSRAVINKSYFQFFLIAAVAAVVGMILMANHAFANVQSWCFDFVAWAIGWSMAYEYRYIIAHGKQEP
ncbi:MAG: hypothetical protein ABI142_11285 [Bryocella sp.]